MLTVLSVKAILEIVSSCNEGIAAYLFIVYLESIDTYFLVFYGIEPFTLFMK